MPSPSDEIFILKKDKLVPMPSRSMRTGLMGKTLEEALQVFFEKYPQIIPGKQIDPGSDDPPRFVLLRREMPVGNWSLDHLYVDQKGILTLVETKLFQNPESRREVIGQIIEYAANAVDYWAAGRARQSSVEFWSKQNKDLDDVIRQEFGEDLDIDALWNNIEENLKDGLIRILIATDELRPEVRRMIEYLNKEMQNAQVLGLEIKFYGEEESLVLVPRLVGQTQSAIDRKGAVGDRANILWTYGKLNTAYAEMPDNELGHRLLKVLDWAVDNRYFLNATAKWPTFGLQGKSKNRIVTFFKDGTIYVFINEKHYAGGIEERNKFIDELKELGIYDENLNLDQVVSGRNSPVKLNELSDVNFEKFLKS